MEKYWILQNPEEKRYLKFGKEPGKCKVHGHITILQMDESTTPHEPVRLCVNCGIEVSRQTKK